MYNAWWSLEENPFSLSPDPSFFYPSQQHEEAFANLTYGIESRKGFIALTGETGTGKTTVLECLRDFLRQRYIGYITISNSRLSVQEFFELIAYELRCGRSSKPEVLFTLNQLLVQEAEAGRTTVLIVDEAQNLEQDVLEEIRLLGNLEDRYGKLLQIVLAGQPELDRKLDTPELRQLKQRIVLRCSLRPFTEEETAGYVAARLERAGMPDQRVFPPQVLNGIHRRAQGIPRMINAICDNLLLMTSALGEREATAQMLDRVSEQMRLDGPSGSYQAGAAADPTENAIMDRRDWKPMSRRAPGEAKITSAMAAGVPLEPLPPLPLRRRGAARFAWMGAAVVAALGGLTLVTANDLWRIRQLMPDTWAQASATERSGSETSSQAGSAEASFAQPSFAQPSSTEPNLTQPTSTESRSTESRSAEPAPPEETPTPQIEIRPTPTQVRPRLNAKADPPPILKPFERPPPRAPEPLRIPAPKPAPTVTPSPSIAPATAQNEPAPARRDPEVFVDIKPAPLLTPQAPAPAPPVVPSRFTGGWSYPINGRFYGSEPEFVELAIREDNGHLMGGLSVRFKEGSGALRGPLQFGFGGDLRSTSIQTFSIETKNGDRGTIELIPGSTPNSLEVNFHARLSGGQTQSGNMILVKKASSSL